MSEKMKKLTVLLLALLFAISCFSGCGEAATAESTVDLASSVPVESEVEEAPAAEPEPDVQLEDNPQPVESVQEEISIVEEAPEVEISYPLEDAPTLTYFYPLSRSGAYTDMAAECQIFSELRERTGVEITFISPSWTAAAEQYNLMISSYELTDLVMHTGGATPVKGYDYMIEEELYLPLNDLLEEFAPDYNAIITADPALYKGVCTDNGYLYGFMMIYDDAFTTQAGLVTRQDWLDELEMEVPDNIEDFTAMLEAFKTNYNCTQTLIMTSTMLLPGNTINCAYGTNASWVVKDDTEYLSAYTMDNFRDYIALLADYYASGYFTSDFVSVYSAIPPQTSSIYSDDMAVWVAFYNDIATMNEAGASVSEGFSIVPIPKLSLTAEDEVAYDDRPSMFSTENAAITTACENPEVAAMWLNYFYTEEGNLLANYGVEGVTFEYNAEGKPEFTDFVTNNSDGKNLTTMLELYALNSGTFYRTWARNFDVCAPEDQTAYNLWNQVGDVSYTSSPALTLTQEESDVVASMYTDISTYASEILPKYILGDIPMSQWEEFRNTVKEMGIDEVTAAYQSALDRYNSR